MASEPIDGLVIAFGWYDGEEEGVARYRDTYSFFVRTRASGEDDDLETYSAIPIDAGLFEDIASLVDVSEWTTEVGVYDGANDALNQKLGEVEPLLQAELGRTGTTLSGLTYLDAVRRSRANEQV